MVIARCLVHQPGGECGHQIGRFAEIVGDVVRDEGVGQHGQRQRVSPAKPGEPVTTDLRDTGMGQQPAALYWIEWGKGQVGDDRTPPGIGSPRRGGRLPAGEHDDDVGGQGRDQPIPDPRVDRRQPFVSVHEQHPGPRVDSTTQRGTTCRVDRRLQSVGGPVNVLTVHADHGPTGGAGKDPELVQ